MREADLSVSEAAFDEMGIEELVSLAREAGLVDIEELACHGNGAVVQVEVESRYDEGRLSSLSYVDQWTHVAETGGTHLYVLSFTAPALPDGISDQAADLVGTCDPEITDQGATISLSGPQDAISGTVSEYESAGVSPDLRKLGGYEGPDRPLDDLTDKQRDVVRAAWELGYYEVPREASSENVAAELDLDPSTVAEHLQRAERNLLGNILPE